MAVLNSSTLLVTHQALDPVNISFSVVQPPQYGRLLLGDYAASAFTQADVNADSVRYQHTGNGSADGLVLDVSNGIASRERLELPVRVVPQVILLETGNVSVQEGGEAVLDGSHISAGPLRQLLPQLLVVEPPQHGRLSALAFSPEQLEAGELRYTHDGSETLRDWFTVVARGVGRESLPGTVHGSEGSLPISFSLGAAFLRRRVNLDDSIFTRRTLSLIAIPGCFHNHNARVGAARFL